MTAYEYVASFIYEGTPVDTAVLAVRDPDGGVASLEFEYPTNQVITSRRIVYHGSAGGDQIATDKRALLPGQTASFANYTSFVNGITGIAIDFARPVSEGDLSLEDFGFLVGNSDDPLTWSAVADPTLTVLEAGGEGGADRVLLTWEPGTVVNTWLEVRLVADETVGRAEETFLLRQRGRRDRRQSVERGGERR